MWDSKKGRVAVGCGVMVAVSVLVGLVIYYASKDPYCKCEDLNRDRPPFVCPDPVITVEEGSLVGSCKPDITGNGKQYAAFFGVPYAKPPVGELRFKSCLQEQTFWLRGAVAFVGSNTTTLGHHIAYAHPRNNVWEMYDDLSGTVQINS
ncbi:uncharacterized protein LOC113210630 isoform X2 [Frankliniella occidentalis]|uniref:Uncharacterized protein LOC113210630 isoform X2 n=1 Tax=Frankliniella occidentalis TaxID=133901 RepID=A0A9C6X5D9_FRAOC|nr:uncharacterized protein LOC113210630 isoform X2 [Frankliniella occidentalis]